MRSRLPKHWKHPTSRQPFTDQVERRPCPQHDAGMRLLGLQLDPLRAPSLERQHDFRQLASGLGRFIGGATAVRPATDLDDTGVLEILQARREQAAGEPWRSLCDLVERSAPDQNDVPQDDDGPAFVEQLRSSSDGAVLPVGSHIHSLLHTSTPGQFNF